MKPTGRTPTGLPVITELQGRYLRAIADLRRELGYPPRIREVGERVGTSPNIYAWVCNLRLLAKKGLVVWQERMSRTLQLTPLGEEFAAAIAADIESAPRARKRIA